jgi:hypothetical protein
LFQSVAVFDYAKSSLAVAVVVVVVVVVVLQERAKYLSHLATTTNKAKKSYPDFLQKDRLNQKTRENGT